MIRSGADFAALAARLADKARALAEARAEVRKGRRASTDRWRSARLLWPLCTKG
jgi:hypothetical protein